MRCRQGARPGDGARGARDPGHPRSRRRASAGRGVGGRCAVPGRRSQGDAGCRGRGDEQCARSHLADVLLSRRPVFLGSRAAGPCARGPPDPSAGPSAARRGAAENRRAPQSSSLRNRTALTARRGGTSWPDLIREEGVANIPPLASARRPPGHHVADDRRAGAAVCAPLASARHLLRPPPGGTTRTDSYRPPGRGAASASRGSGPGRPGTPSRSWWRAAPRRRAA